MGLQFRQTTIIEPKRVQVVDVRHHKEALRDYSATHEWVLHPLHRDAYVLRLSTRILDALCDFIEERTSSWGNHPDRPTQVIKRRVYWEPQRFAVRISVQVQVHYTRPSLIERKAPPGFLSALGEEVHALLTRMRRGRRRSRAEAQLDTFDATVEAVRPYIDRRDLWDWPAPYDIVPRSWLLYGERPSALNTSLKNDPHDKIDPDSRWGSQLLLVRRKKSTQGIHIGEMALTCEVAKLRRDCSNLSHVQVELRRYNQHVEHVQHAYELYQEMIQAALNYNSYDVRDAFRSAILRKRRGGA